MSDPLSLFFKDDEEDEKYWPGNTPPKNVGGTVDPGKPEWLTSLPSRQFMRDGKPENFYTIGALAQALNRSPVTVRSWEQKGWLPSPKFRTQAPKSAQLPGKAVKGKRLYTEAQVVFLVEAFMRFRVDGPRKTRNWDGLREHIKTHYPN